MLLARKHIQFIERCLRLLPKAYQTEDQSRLSLVFFALGSLELLDALTSVITDAQTASLLDWIYSLQCSQGGFQGSPACQQTPHLVMCYTGVLSLAILDDDFTRLDRKGLAHFVRSCQNPDGSFATYPGSSEIDLRSTYCAFVIQDLLKLPMFDQSNAIGFIMSCQRYDDSFAQNPGLEGNGGSTYCAIASLALAGRLDNVSHDTLTWLLHRQQHPSTAFFQSDVDSSSDEDDGAGDGNSNVNMASSKQNKDSDAPIAFKVASMAGYQGRPHKDVDACYSFWIGASIRILSQGTLEPNAELDRKYLLECQHELIGGFANQPGNPSDLYHTYLALAALSISGRTEPLPLDPVINTSQRTLKRLRARLEELYSNNCLK